MSGKTLGKKKTRVSITDTDMPVYAALVTAAGLSSRMGGGVKKEYSVWGGKSLVLRSLEAFEKTGLFSLFVVTVPVGGEAEARGVLAPWLSESLRAGRTFFVEGGDTRQRSVYAGLLALEPYKPDVVLVHDGARPWVSPELILSVVRGAEVHGACLPVSPAVDAVKKIDSEGFVEAHLERNCTRGAQTPQGFLYERILSAHGKALASGAVSYTDDSEIYDAFCGRVFSVPGDEKNKKVTYRSDLASGSSPECVSVRRVGLGYDIHRLVEGRRLLVGGVEIPFSKGEDGHSDGDVLVHAVIDALLGAAGLGDIGSHFPPSDPEYRDISSRVLLRRAIARVRGEGFFPVNLDCTVILEAPKILPYRDSIIAALAEDIGLPAKAISVKGKTKEKVDAAGEGRAVEAFATALLA
jgi:2-C-methyl-D-erythritol 4-phosphate cytidylyltransferase/2-C-methyl-D-erythritol 2,4-cyclodiphosphate synthase